MGGTKESPVSPESTDRDIAARWRVCLHEAGHAVAGRVMLKRTVRAVVYGDNVGAAYLDIADAIPATFGESLAIAAGPAAEALADSHPPPDAPLLVPLEVTYAEQVIPPREHLRECLPDHIAVARWCIGGIEKQPDRWAKRYNWIHREAQIFVARHRQEIVDVAMVLYVRGITMLQTELHEAAKRNPARAAAE